MVHSFVNLLVALLFGLLAMALFTLIERRTLAFAQLRKGPNKPTYLALLLPFLDAMKLLSKQAQHTAHRSKSAFFIAPFLAILCASVLWLMLPLFSASFSLKNSFIVFLAISTLHAYTILAMGWSSNSKFCSMGMSRSLAQTLSYEISMALILIVVVLPTKTLAFDTFMANGVPLIMCLPTIFFMWVLSCVAETSRAPFDAAEGESELVSGFNTEYGASKFALIFMAEYLSILVMSALTTILFLLPSNLPILFLLSPFVTCAIAIFFVALRATLPRIRYDSLMWAAWGVILPFTLIAAIFILPLMI